MTAENINKLIFAGIGAGFALIISLLVLFASTYYQSKVTKNKFIRTSNKDFKENLVQHRADIQKFMNIALSDNEKKKEELEDKLASIEFKLNAQEGIDPGIYKKYRLYLINTNTMLGIVRLNNLRKSTIKNYKQTEYFINDFRELKKLIKETYEDLIEEINITIEGAFPPAQEV